MISPWLVRALLLACVGAAWWAARKTKGPGCPEPRARSSQPQHAAGNAPILRVPEPAVKLAIALSALLACDLAHLGAQAILGGPRPFTGPMRAVFSAEQALFVGHVAGVTALVCGTFAGRSWRAVVAGWIAASIGLAAAYPELRQKALTNTAHPTIQAAFLLACAVAIAGLRRRPTVHELPALVLFCGEFASLVAGPWLKGDPANDWKYALGIASATYVLTLIAIGAATCARASNQRSAG